MEKIFKLQAHGTTASTEINAGLTTFFAMAYIIFVNPSFLAMAGMDESGVMIATCLSAAIGSLICAFFANKPYAMASGMGLNTFFAFTLCGEGGFSWQQALSLTLIAGVLFLIITILPVRDQIIEAVPDNIKHAISAGIGIFITLIGLLNSGLIVMTEGFPAMADVQTKHAAIVLTGLLVTIVLVVCHVKGNLFIGMVITAIISLIAGETKLPETAVSLPGAISKVAFHLDFNLLQGSGIGAVFTLIALIFSMTMVDMFDTLGFLIGATSSAQNMEAEQADDEEKVSGRVLISDAIGTCIGALCGTSTVTTYAESAAGIAAGGRTGLTTLTVSILFLVSTFFAPLTSLVTAAVTSPALIIVGMYLIADIRNIDFSRMDDAIPAFLTLIAIPFSYSITTGISIGFIAYLICKIAARKWEVLNPGVIILGLIFALYFLLA